MLKSFRATFSLLAVLPMFSSDGCESCHPDPTPPVTKAATWAKPGDEAHPLLGGEAALVVSSPDCDAPRLSVSLSGDATSTLELQGSRAGETLSFSYDGHSMLGASDRCALTGAFGVTATLRCGDGSARVIAEKKTIRIEAPVSTLPVTGESLVVRRVQRAEPDDTLVFASATRVHGVRISDGKDTWSEPAAATLWPHMHQTGTHHKFVVTGPNTILAAANDAASKTVVLTISGNVFDIADDEGKLVALTENNGIAKLVTVQDAPSLEGAAQKETLLPAGVPLRLSRKPGGVGVMAALKLASDGLVHYFDGPLNAEVPVPYPVAGCGGGGGGTSGSSGGSTIPMSNGNEAGTSNPVASGTSSNCSVKISAPFVVFRDARPSLGLNNASLDVAWPADWTEFAIIDALSMDNAVLLVARINGVNLGAVLVDVGTRATTVLAAAGATHYDGGSSSPDAKRAVIGFDGKLVVVNRDGVVQAKLKGLPPGCGGFAPLGATFASNNALLLRATNNTFVLGL